MICDSPSYIYDFALPISPPSSWLHQFYSAEFSQEIKVVKGVSAGWGTCLRTVLLNDGSEALACWKDTIAVGLHSGTIIILNAITGIQMATLSEHTDGVTSLAFSVDGTLLVSGSNDCTAKLWDTQTGGVVKTFQSYTGAIGSISISADCTTIALGLGHMAIHLWDIQTGECHHIEQGSGVHNVCFSPLDPKHLRFISDGKIWQWDIDSQKIAPECDGFCMAFSLDGTQFAVCDEVVEVQRSDSKEIVARFLPPKKYIRCCCFSPDNRVIAVAANKIIYIWDITSSDPHPLETFIGHDMNVSSIAFSSPSSLISTSQDKSVKFWKISAQSTDPVLAAPASTPLASAPIKSITLQAKGGIAISNHSDGMVRVWDVSTGLCKASFQTPAKDSYWMDTHLTSGRLISVWYKDKEIYIWDTEKGKLLRTVQIAWGFDRDFRMSGDGSKVFYLSGHSILAWSIWTGEVIGEVRSRLPLPGFLTIDGQKVWVQCTVSESIEGWDFGILGSAPVRLLDTSKNGLCLDSIGGIKLWRSFLPGAQDTVSTKVVFQLPVRLARPSDAQWDGQYLVVGYNSDEVLILECNCVHH